MVGPIGGDDQLAGHKGMQAAADLGAAEDELAALARHELHLGRPCPSRRGVCRHHPSSCISGRLPPAA